MKEKPSTENEQKCCSGLELAVREQTLRICPLGIDHAERTFYNLLEFSTAYHQGIAPRIDLHTGVVFGLALVQSDGNG